MGRKEIDLPLQLQPYYLSNLQREKRWKRKYEYNYLYLSLSSDVHDPLRVQIRQCLAVCVTYVSKQNHKVN
jgi:hypothetical protein